MDVTHGADVEEGFHWGGGAETAKTKNGVEVRKQQEHESHCCWDSVLEVNEVWCPFIF